MQLAKAHGTEVTGVCSAAKADLVRSLGADHTIDYATEHFASPTRRWVAHVRPLESSTMQRCTFAS